MTVHKVCFLLFLGMLLVVTTLEHADAKICPFNCDGRLAYSICPKESGSKKNYRICTNCCAARVGCQYYSTNGTFICEGQPDMEIKEVVERPKPCPRNCDGRVAYMTCPALGLAKVNQVCVNCCTAGEGCKLYANDGSLICTGRAAN